MNTITGIIPFIRREISYFFKDIANDTVKTVFWSQVVVSVSKIESKIIRQKAYLTMLLVITSYILSQAFKKYHLENKNVVRYVDINNIENSLNSEILGQTEAITKIMNSLLAFKYGLLEEKPLVCLIVGESGTGKTKFSEQLAKNLNFELKVFDLSQYTQEHTVANLIGSPPGYVGHKEGGELQNFIKKYPACIVLLDEFDKAHKKLIDFFIGIFEGRLTDKGEKINLSKVIFLCTSNYGFRYLQLHREKYPQATPKQRENFMLLILNRILPAHFLSRVTPVFFKAIGTDHATKIALKELDKQIVDLHTKAEMEVEMESNCKQQFIKAIFPSSTHTNVRELEKKIRENLTNPLLRYKETKYCEKFIVTMKDSTNATTNAQILTTEFLNIEGIKR